MSVSLPALSQQPRWLLLSIFLILWSWSTSLRRDGGRTKALGIGVDARSFVWDWEAKRQDAVGLPVCAQQCAVQSQEAIGCGDALNFPCACHSEQFMPVAVTCMTSNCTQTDKESGEAALNIACKAVGTSVSPPTSFSSGVSTSITSGVPPISGSPTTTVITVSTTGASTSETDSSTSSGAASSTSLPPSTTVTATTTAPLSSTTVSATSIATETSLSTGTTVTASNSASSPSSSSGSGSGNGSASTAHEVSMLGVVFAVVLAVISAVVSL